jgi:hypothetical protein
LTQALTFLPPALKTGELVLLPKPGAHGSAPTNYRPVTLLPMFTRLLQKAIYIKVRPLLWPDTGDSPIHPAQAGFVPRGNYLDQVLFLLILITRQHNLRHWSTHGGLYAAFLDLFKAFDTLDHGHGLTSSGTSLFYRSSGLKSFGAWL